MTYYAFIENNQINGVGQVRCLNENILNYEISQDIFENIEKYIWDGEKHDIILNPNYDIEQLKKAKEEKYFEANEKAKNYLEGGIATFELLPTFHIEATKENMNTMTSAAIAIEKGLIEYRPWTSKEDNVLDLTQEQCLTISMGIGAIQGDVWNRQYINYKNQIEQAKTIEEIEKIVIDYSNN